MPTTEPSFQMHSILPQITRPMLAIAERLADKQIENKIHSRDVKYDRLNYDKYYLYAFV